MKQQVTVAMMRMPTNKAEDTPITKGMRRRSAAGRREKQYTTITKKYTSLFSFKEGKHSRMGER